MALFKVSSIVCFLFFGIALVGARLVKRSHSSFMNGGIVIDIGWETVSSWAGVTSMVCKFCGGAAACCIGGAVFATIVAAAVAVSVDSSKFGSTSANTNMRRDLSNFNNVTSDFANWTEPFSSQGLSLLGVYATRNDLYKRDSTVNDIRPFIQFESSFGKHVAVHYADGSLHELASFLLEAEPNKPLIKNTLQKRGEMPGDDGFEPLFVTYNYDNVNRDLATDFSLSVNGGDSSALSGDITEVMMNHRGWKYCASMGYGGSGSDADLNDGATGIAAHGEIYFNTY